MNTDGSSLGTPGAAGASGIFRTPSGFPHGAFTFHIDFEFAYVAEIVAAIYAVEMAWSKGWKNLWLECDSLLVVNLFHKLSNQVPWKIQHRWLHCFHLISQMNFQKMLLLML